MSAPLLRRASASFAVAALSLAATSLATLPAQDPPEGTRGLGNADSDAARTAAFGKFRALLIGIEKYPDPRYATLTTPHNDIKYLGAVLRDKYGFQIDTLTEETATRTGILRRIFQYRSELGPDDSLLIHFAGHGHYIDEQAQYEKRLGFWIPWDGGGKPEDESTWIEVKELLDLLRRLPCRHVLLLSDSCYSGSLWLAALTRGNTSQPAGPADAERGRPVDGGTAPVDAEASAATLKSLLGELGWRRFALRSREAISSGALTPVADEGANHMSPFAGRLVDVLTYWNEPTLTSEELFVGVERRLSEGGFPQTPMRAPIGGPMHQNGQFVLINWQKLGLAAPRERQDMGLPFGYLLPQGVAHKLVDGVHRYYRSPGLEDIEMVLVDSTQKTADPALELPTPFLIDRHEVTVDSFRRWAGSQRNSLQNVDYRKDAGFVQDPGRRPVVGINLDEALAYAAAFGMELPTDRQWRVAAAWTGTAFRDHPWEGPFENGRLQPENFPPLQDAYPLDRSPWGALAMGGGVREWSRPTDPQHVEQRLGVICGGSQVITLRGDHLRNRCDHRQPIARDRRFDDVGFRCVRTLAR